MILAECVIRLPQIRVRSQPQRELADRVGDRESLLPVLDGAVRVAHQSEIVGQIGRGLAETALVAEGPRERLGFAQTFENAPEFAERVRDANRESEFIGSAELPGYVRKPFGDGWALIGDAGYH